MNDMNSNNLPKMNNILLANEIAPRPDNWENVADDYTLYDGLFIRYIFYQCRELLIMLLNIILSLPSKVSCHLSCRTIERPVLYTIFCISVLVILTLRIL